MNMRRMRIGLWTLAFATIVVGSLWIARLRFAETEAELKARLSEEDLTALIAWSRETALNREAAPRSWEDAELPDQLRRVGVKRAKTNTFGDKYVFFYLHTGNGKSGLLVAEPTARWPDPPADWSQWRPGLWFHRE